MVDHGHGSAMDAWLTMVMDVAMDVWLAMVMEVAMMHG